MQMLRFSDLCFFRCANSKCDVKKVIALSSLSLLGFIKNDLFLDHSNLAFIYLLIRALFKALLFMCTGNLIRSRMGNCQDMRYKGSFVPQMPLTIPLFRISNVLCRLPFSSGFYSKDLILEALFIQQFIFVL